MGGVWSSMKEQLREHERKEVEIFVKELKDGPDLTVNRSIVMFTSLAAPDNLRRHYEGRKMEADDCAADWIKALVEKLSDFLLAPELAGLGALAVAIFIDVASFSPPEESTKEALRCVFAEEKASEVWDQIDECLKRCMMNMKNKAELVSDIRRIEHQLSATLTKLKNSMVRDGHMSTPALRAWVNGAAFHIQMLIHLVRLGGIQTCDPVEGLLSAYLSDLDPLFREHRAMIEGKCRKEGTGDITSPVCQLMVDEEQKYYSLDPHCRYEKYLEAYYDHRYGRQKANVQRYFRDVRQELQELVAQRGSFRV